MNIIQSAQPYVTTVVTALIGLLATWALIGINALKAKANVLYEARTTAAQREQLHRIASEAFAYAETVFRDYGGEQKLAEAKGYLLQRLNALGITLTDAEIRAVIEKVVLEYNAKVKPPVTNSAAVPQPAEQPTPQVVKEIPPEAQNLIDAAIAFVHGGAVVDQPTAQVSTTADQPATPTAAPDPQATIPTEP
jgi:hypothetical protein